MATATISSSWSSEGIRHRSAGTEPKGVVTKIVSLKDEFSAFSRDSKTIQHITQQTQGKYREMKQALSEKLRKSMNDYNVSFLSREHVEKIDKVKHGPNLIVIGQTNSGKSSLINELLQGTVLTMRQIPCTARLVKVRYGKPQRVMVVSQTGKVLEERALKKKAIPKDLVELTEEQRRDSNVIGSYVLAEIDNEFLASGIEIVDSPGLQENEKLDELVLNELVKSVPFVVYVLDGKNQFTEQDRSDIRKIHSKSSAIFYVVTKVDRDQDDPNDEMSVVAEKKNRAYNSLVREGLLPDDVPMEECEYFHGISNWKVKEYRRKKQTGPNPFVNDFLRFQRCLCNFVCTSLNAIILSASNILLTSHTGCLNFFIDAATKAKEREDRTVEQARLLKRCADIEDKVFTEAQEKLNGERSEMKSSIKSVMKTQEHNIISRVKKYKFRDIPADQVVKKGAMYEKCVTQIEEFVFDCIGVNVVSNLRKRFEKQDKILTKLARSIAQIGRDTGDPRVAAVLKNCTMASYKAETIKFVKDQNTSLLSKVKTWLKNVFVNPLRAFRSEIKIDEKWKATVAEKALEGIDINSVTDQLIAQATDHLEHCRCQFTKATENVAALLNSVHVCNEEDKTQLRKFAPDVASLELAMYTIIDRREFGMPTLDGKKIGEGGQGSVYECGRMGTPAIECVVKIVNMKPGAHINTDVAMEVHYTRSIEHERILPLLASIKVDDTLYLITQRMKWDLQKALPHCKRPRDRLRIALQISEGLEYLHSRGLVHRDIKTPNILLDDRGRVKIADMGLCKAEALMNASIVGSPLHMPPEQMLGMRYDKSVDVYAFGILLWFICDGTGQLPTKMVAGMMVCPQLMSAVGCRPEKLPHFDERSWKLMESCWTGDWSERPTFTQITEELRSILGLRSSKMGQKN
ncbi:dual serine/threonine and tyrosine protein kinase-like [Glandiceps talaboti]